VVEIKTEDMVVEIKTEDMVVEIKTEDTAVEVNKTEDTAEETRTTMVHKTRMEETEVDIITTMVVIMVIMVEETMVTVLRMITTITIWFKNPKLKEKENLFQSLLPNQLKLKNLKKENLLVLLKLSLKFQFQ